MMNGGLIAENKKKISFIEIVLPIFYILNQYSVGSLSIGFFLLLIVIFLEIIRDRFFCVYRPLLWLFAFMLLHDIAKWPITENFLNVGLWIERTVYLLFLSCIINKIDSNNLYKTWSCFGIIAMGGLFFQSVQVYLLGQSVGMINLFPFLTSSTSGYVAKYFRPHSFFAEPAAFSTWILPLLIMAIQRKKFVYSVIITVSILLSTSSVGILIAAIVWLYFAFVDRESKNYRIIVVAIMLIGVGIFLNTDIFSSALQKLTSISLNNTSNSVRLVLGFQLFAGLPLIQKILGIPFSNVETYLRSGNVNLNQYGLSLTTPYLGYVNSAGNCLLNYGLIGFAFYMQFFYRLLKDIGKYWYCYLLIFFVAIFGQSTFWNSIFVTQFAILLGCAGISDCIIFTFGKH